MSLPTLSEFASSVKPPSASDVPPLLRQLVEVHGADWVDLAGLDAWMQQPGDRVLLIGGDPVRFPECLDVAVVLPVLHRHFQRRFAMGVARRDAEDAIGARLAASRRPTLVFLRDGQYVTAIGGMQDWDVYLQEVARALAMPTTRIPGIGIAVVAAAGPACHGAEHA